MVTIIKPLLKPFYSPQLNPWISTSLQDNFLAQVQGFKRVAARRGSMRLAVGGECRGGSSGGTPWSFGEFGCNLWCHLVVFCLKNG